MEENKGSIKEGVLMKTVSYSKKFVWEIENFVEWWSSRLIAESNRNNATTWEEEMNVEEPKNWEKSSGSPLFLFEINGVNHQFRIDILKFDSWDRLEDVHNLMMGISLFYNGPWDSILVKPLFWVKDSGTQFSNTPIETTELKKGTNSYARVFSDHSIASNINEILNPHFQLFCSIQIDIVDESMFRTSLEQNVSEMRNFNRLLHQNLDFTSNNGFLKQFSDFEIIGIDQNENGENIETTLYCNRIVLYIGSEYYRRMFSGNFVESQGRVKVTDVSCKTMIKVLQYLYTGNINKAEIDVDVMYAADKYEMKHLHAVSEFILGENLDVNNVFDIALVANHCGSNNFKGCVNRFLCKKWKKIKVDKRSQMFLNNPVYMKEILNQL